MDIQQLINNAAEAAKDMPEHAQVELAECAARVESQSATAQIVLDVLALAEAAKQGQLPV